MMIQKTYQFGKKKGELDMANMSYCRFHNTRLDLQDCLDAISDCASTSAHEVKTGRLMFDDFLSFCQENGIIDSYDMEAVEAMFEGMVERHDDDE